MTGLILKTNKTNYIVSEIIDIGKCIDPSMIVKKYILIDLNNGKSIGSENFSCLKNIADFDNELSKRDEKILCIEK